MAKVQSVADLDRAMCSSATSPHAGARFARPCGAVQGT
jgi:hypothetical protein